MNPLKTLSTLIINLLYKYHEKAFCYIIVFLLTPGLYIFEMSIVRPELVQIYNMGSSRHILHIFCSAICFLNVAGNLVMSVVTDPSLKRTHDHGVYCAICRKVRPMASWHCSTCNVCILRRDHHCVFLSRCIGLRNQRYFILFLGHVMVSMLYCSYHNYYYVLSKFEDLGMLISAIRILNPILRFMIPEPMGVKDLLMLFFIMNVGLLIWSSFMFTWHLKNVLRGVTAYESKVCYSDMANWKENLVNVFGVRWPLAMIFPFVSSPLPVSVRIKYS